MHFKFIISFLFSFATISVGFAEFRFEGEDDLNVFEEPIFVPIEQEWPERHDQVTDNLPINKFGDIMPYWHHYPEMLGYIRHGNARCDGDHGYWFLRSDTNAEGRGGLFIEFPPRRNSVDASPSGGSQGDYDGLFHISHRGFVRGYNVLVVPIDEAVDFGPEHGKRYKVDVPIARATVLGHYMAFTAEPFKRYSFLLNRQVIWGDRPYPNHNTGPARRAPKKKEKDEL